MTIINLWDNLDNERKHLYKPISRLDNFIKAALFFPFTTTEQLKILFKFSLFTFQSAKGLFVQDWYRMLLTESEHLQKRKKVFLEILTLYDLQKQP